MEVPYRVRRDVLDRIHQNPNAVPVVNPDNFGDILGAADVVAIAHDAVRRLGLPALSENVLERLGALDEKGFIAHQIKGNRDLIGYLDNRGYDDSPGSLAAWTVLWDGMRDWDNRKWDWAEIATGAALASLCCPLVEEYEQIVLAHGSTAH